MKLSAPVKWRALAKASVLRLFGGMAMLMRVILIMMGVNDGD